MSTVHITTPSGPSEQSPKHVWQRLGEYAFRPFFLLLVLQAVGMIGLWALWWQGALPVAWQRNPIYWHGHEMLSGFAGAAIGGFLLTAVATWTSRPPVGGWRLWLLCALWLGARLSFLAPWAHAICDMGYWLLLWGLMANEVLRAGNRRNYKILLVLALLALSDIAWHVAELGNSPWLRQSTWGQLWLVLLLVCVIGGRIIPAFTGNWLRRQAAEAKPPRKPDPLPAAFGRLDLASLLTLLLFAVCSLASVPDWMVFASGWLAAILHAWRLSRWQGLRCLSDPLVWMLHLSYAWIPVGLVLVACAALGWVPVSAGLHALTVGCVAGMIVSVSARAALGHTKRPLRSHPLLTTAIVLLNLAALLRVGAAIAALPLLMALASLAWTVAFLCYARVYVPILLGPSNNPLAGVTR